MMGEDEKGQGRGKVVITFQALKAALCLPDDATIYGVEMTPDDLSRDQFKVFVKHCALPYWEEGMAVPVTGVNIKTETAVIKREFYGWL